MGALWIDQPVARERGVVPNAVGKAAHIYHQIALTDDVPHEADSRSKSRMRPNPAKGIWPGFDMRLIQHYLKLATDEQAAREEVLSSQLHLTIGAHSRDLHVPATTARASEPPVTLHFGIPHEYVHRNKETGKRCTKKVVARASLLLFRFPNGHRKVLVSLAHTSWYLYGAGARSLKLLYSAITDVSGGLQPAGCS
jgi:hypothetical protein